MKGRAEQLVGGAREPKCRAECDPDRGTDGKAGEVAGKARAEMGEQGAIERLRPGRARDRL
jgi:hypothetical protein